MVPQYETLCHAHKFDPEFRGVSIQLFYGFVRVTRRARSMRLSLRSTWRKKREIVFVNVHVHLKLLVVISLITSFSKMLMACSYRYLNWHLFKVGNGPFPELLLKLPGRRILLKVRI